MLVLLKTDDLASGQVGQRFAQLDAGWGFPSIPSPSLVTMARFVPGLQMIAGGHAASPSSNLRPTAQPKALR